jgi:DNA repair photolyase
MPIDLTHTTVKNTLTRTSGFLRTVSSHSLQPYRGCSYGNALCGVGCYVQHNGHLTRGRAWGSFLEVRDNAAEAYAAGHARESAWARAHRGTFSIFCSSSTDPFVPQERTFRTTGRVLQAMLTLPPDELILQTHSHFVLDELETLKVLQDRCRLRVHVSIESDRDTLPGLPPSASCVEQRLRACTELKQAGIPVVVAVSPLLPILDPPHFFQRIAEVADAVVIDHFIGGDGTATGARTAKTALPAAMEKVAPESTTLTYRDQMVREAQRYLPGRVGVNIDGFAGRFLPSVT